MVFALRSHALVIGAVTFIVMGGGVALGARLAAIPGNDGVIHGCYNQVNGQLRVVESATECKNSELAIQWNQSGPAGASGAAGAAGTSGSTGATGPAGANGANGAAGATGPVGAGGVTGSSGSTGATGPAGANGATGANGAIGATGGNGAIGATGNAGAIGATGAVGPSGATGDTGSSGAAGPTGASGASGATGPIGETGAAGVSGVTGATGPRGATGTAGATGPAGQSNPIAEADTGRFLLPCGPFFCIALTDEAYVSNAGDTNAHNLTSLATIHGSGTEFLIATGHCQIQGPNTVYVSIEDVSNSVTVAAFVGQNNRYAKLVVPAITANVGSSNSINVNTGIWELSFAVVRQDPAAAKTYYLNFFSTGAGSVACAGELVATWTSATNP